MKGYEFFSLAKNIGKKICKNLSGIYNRNLLFHVKKWAINVLKLTLKRVIQR